MRAVVQSRYGDSSVLSVGLVERPTIEPNEVLLEVHSAALDRGTEHLMTGQPWLIRLAGFGLTKPKNPVLGLDVAGTVVAVGSEVTRFEVGDHVFGFAKGSFAEFAAADERKLAHKPSSLGFEGAAAASVSGITALQAVTDVGRLESGQRVLVIGASGGVGSYAVQIASALGGIVDGVAGTRNLDLVRSLGAEDVFDHSTTDLAEIDQRYDLILDIGGRNPIRKLRRLLTEKGTLVIVGGENGNRVTGGISRQLRAVALSPFVSQRLTMFISREHHELIERLAVLLESGDVVPAIGGRFPLEQAPEAMRQLESGQASGKTVINVKGAARHKEGLNS
ncbi:MAG: NAD(P)-dependent alcohol dehydrogenase [Acidimicrobiales bacterium]|nr:NAD(P)-dependent alcohol dehydrogenase [Acidimicrobiales bacterium]